MDEPNVTMPTSMDLPTAVVLFAALGCGVNAGLFFIFSNTVMRALGRLPARYGTEAMQAINEVIQNPLFFVVFLGTAVACLGLVVASLMQWSEPGSALLLAGAALYLVGCFGVTAAFNVPMNNALDRVDASDAAAEPVWRDYLVRWTQWNHVRTVACIGAMAFLMLWLYGQGAAA